MDERQIENIAEEFQAKLLGYRLAHHDQVRASTFDVADFTAPMRALARSLGACIVGDPELQNGIVPLLKDRDEAVRAERSTGPRAVVLEAVLFHCHEGRKSSVYVGEVGRAVKAILDARGETLTLEDRAVGAILNSLGLRTGRLNGKGRGLRLLQSVRRKAHELAQEYEVRLVEEKVAGCADCAAVRGKSLGEQSFR